MAPPQPESKPVLTGGFARPVPLKLVGWVGCSACADRGNATTITVLNQGRVIGSGVANLIRSDTPSAHQFGFLITCDEPIADAGIALGDYVVEARDQAGHSAALPMFPRARAATFARLLDRAPPADNFSAASILGWLAGSRELPMPVIAQLRACRDALLPPRKERPASAMAVAKDPAAEAERRFWFRFESLAGDCTLGMIQRRAGAEPLALLRFTSAPAGMMVIALKKKLAGVGSPKFTRLEVNGLGEYMSRDTRYHMLSHTFIYQDEMPFERLFQQQCRKIAYLARNLLEDIIEGDKIFVFYDAHHRHDPEHVRRLHLALRQHGPGWLVNVQSLAAGNPAIGTAVREADGFITAYIGPEEGTSPAERFANWRAACGAAAAIVDASRSPTRVAAE